MRLFDIVIPFLLVSAGFASEWNDPKLPMADPGKACYQNVIPGVMGLGGYWEKVRVHDLTPAELIDAVEMQRGADMMWYGMWVAIACAVAHGVIKSSYPPLRPFSKLLEWGVVGGVLAIIGGMFYKKITEYENWIILIGIVCVCGYLLYRYRDWSASHFFRKPTTSSDPATTLATVVGVAADCDEEPDGNPESTSDDRDQ